MPFYEKADYRFSEKSKKTEFKPDGKLIKAGSDGVREIFLLIKDDNLHIERRMGKNNPGIDYSGLKVNEEHTEGLFGPLPLNPLDFFVFKRKAIIFEDENHPYEERPPKTKEPSKQSLIKKALVPFRILRDLTRMEF